jgi:hypothetical protein
MTPPEVLAMKGIVCVLTILTLAGAAFAQQPQVYTPAGSDPSVPTFTNAEVVRLDPSGRTITVRADGRETMMIVEGEGLTGLSRLHPGDHVLLGYRADTRDGHPVVTAIREVLPAPALTATSPSRATNIESVRIADINPSKRRLAVTDGTGARRVVSVTNDAAKTLRQIRVGDDVVLTYRPGTGRTRMVVRIEPVGVSTGGVVTQLRTTSAAVSPVVGSSVATTTTTVVPTVVAPTGTPVTGGMPVPPNYPGGPAVLQPVPNVGPPTSPTLNVALPPATAVPVPETATAAEAIRAQAVRDLGAAASVLALKANEIDNLWYAYKDLCLGGTTPSGAATATGREWFILLGSNTIKQPGDDACRRRLGELTRAAQMFEQQEDAALDAARRTEVAPGTIREILQRNRLDR